MERLELLDVIRELIVNNSNIEAEPDDEVMLDGVEGVTLNVMGTDGDVTVLFADGKTMKITVE